MPTLYIIYYIYVKDIPRLFDRILGKVGNEAYDPLFISENTFYRNLYEIFNDREYIQDRYSNSKAMNIVVLLVNEIIKFKNYNFLPENLKLAWNFLIKNQISDINKNIIFSTT